MNETKRLDITGKIFKIEDLKKIEKIFEDKREDAEKNDNHYSIKYTAYCSDDTSHRSESFDYLIDEIIKIKNTKYIEFSFHNYDNDFEIDFYIAHGNETTFNNKLQISGSNRDEISGIFSKFKDIISSVKPQENWFINHKKLVFHLISLGIGIIISPFVLFVIDFIVTIVVNSVREPSNMELIGKVKVLNEFTDVYPKVKVFLGYFLIFLRRWFFSWVLGLGAGYSITDWVYNLWPDVEFDFGPEHFKIEKKRRRRIGLVLTLVVIPIMINIILSFV